MTTKTTARYMGSLDGCQSRDRATADGARVYRWRESDGTIVVAVARWLPGDYTAGRMTETHRHVFRPHRDH